MHGHLASAQKCRLLDERPPVSSSALPTTGVNVYVVKADGQPGFDGVEQHARTWPGHYCFSTQGALHGFRYFRTLGHRLCRQPRLR